ncbi:putative ABC exporter domain-containing protein [Engelhardtia mirabilis]|uniref:Uncharacterized protein n=1 Tax=Engelhardtia mirabilis TaxID=2528011 RepID=A0A518BIN8_9BACT|nr:hypothetical protein Pla133_18890 [Planctomycetes bacterium Pla133]QDV01139.1 hypothetical protein Pla86_18880 [Planctomycetes bacterium Pla86]
MTAILGAPALRRLLGLKARGMLRRAGRRLRTPSGAVFALLGLGFVVMWLTSIGVAFQVRGDRGLEPRLAVPVARLSVTVLFLLSVSGTIAHRGLYLPAQEIERLFAAPVSRADLVRHRLHILMGQSLVGGLIVALIASVRLPHSLWAAVGALLFVMTIAIAGQTASILLGALERRLPVKALRLAARIFSLALLSAAVGVYVFIDKLPSDLQTSFEAVVTHDAARIVSAPFEPWAQLMNAASLASAAPWLILCLVVLLGLFELTARLPFDFRELALANSADVAARMRRLQRGGGASAHKISSAGGLRRVPWLFGRGPVGAIAWRKTASMLRRARATLGFSAFLLTVLVIAAVAVGDGGERSTRIAGAVLVGVLGTFYLCSGLRFDFREELERMDVLKAWPLASWRLFAAMLLPEAALITAMVGLGLVAHGLATGGVDPVGWVVLAFIPPFVATWLALDNAIFLLWPVRFAPGQEGALQNMGRAAVVVLLRLVVLAVLGAIGVGIGLGLVWVAGSLADASPTVAAVVGLFGGWTWLVVGCWGAIALGGEVLTRFEPDSITN